MSRKRKTCPVCGGGMNYDIKELDVTIDGKCYHSKSANYEYCPDCLHLTLSGEFDLTEMPEENLIIEAIEDEAPAELPPEKEIEAAEVVTEPEQVPAEQESNPETPKTQEKPDEVPGAPSENPEKNAGGSETKTSGEKAEENASKEEPSDKDEKEKKPRYYYPIRGSFSKKYPLVTDEGAVIVKKKSEVKDPGLKRFRKLFFNIKKGFYTYVYDHFVTSMAKQRIHLKEYVPTRKIIINDIIIDPKDCTLIKTGYAFANKYLLKKYYYKTPSGYFFCITHHIDMEHDIAKKMSLSEAKKLFADDPEEYIKYIPNNLRHSMFSEEGKAENEKIREEEERLKAEREKKAKEEAKKAEKEASTGSENTEAQEKAAEAMEDQAEDNDIPDDLCAAGEEDETESESPDKPMMTEKPEAPEEPEAPLEEVMIPVSHKGRKRRVQETEDADKEGGVKEDSPASSDSEPKEEISEEEYILPNEDEKAGVEPPPKKKKKKKKKPAGQEENSQKPPEEKTPEQEKKPEDHGSSQQKPDNKPADKQSGDSGEYYKKVNHPPRPERKHHDNKPSTEG